MTDISVSIEQDRFGNLTITELLDSEKEGRTLYIQGDYEVDYFLDNSIAPLDYHENYVGKKSAREASNELKEDIKGGYVTECLISSLYFPDE